MKQRLSNHLNLIAGLIVLLFQVHAEASARRCETLFFSSNQTILSSIQIDQSIRELSALRVRLDLARAQGANSTATHALETAYDKKWRAWAEYLKIHQIMSTAELVGRMKQEIHVIQSQQAEIEADRRRHTEEERIRDLVIDGTRAVFNRVEPGFFEMGSDKKLVTITQPFDMMATPTTQVIWEKMAQLINKKLGQKYNIRTSPSKFEGDTRPVESITYVEVEIWIQGLNELSQAGQQELFDLIPGHKTGDVYRLPTEAEWEFVLRGRGKYNERYHFGNDGSKIGDYAWYSVNSSRQTHPVALKLPVVFDGNEFYDMLGNVAEWVQDRYGALSGGTDPQGHPSTLSRVIRGGGYNYADGFLGSDSRTSREPGWSEPGIGFRLVREVRP
jgi:formylglycine-generating enzyme